MPPASLHGKRCGPRDLPRCPERQRDLGRAGHLSTYHHPRRLREADQDHSHPPAHDWHLDEGARLSSTSTIARTQTSTPRNTIPELATKARSPPEIATTTPELLSTGSPRQSIPVSSGAAVFVEGGKKSPCRLGPEECSTTPRTSDNYTRAPKHTQRTEPMRLDPGEPGDPRRIRCLS